MPALPPLHLLTFVVEILRSSFQIRFKFNIMAISSIHFKKVLLSLSQLFHGVFFLSEEGHVGSYSHYCLVLGSFLNPNVS